MKGPRSVASWNLVAGCNYRCSYCVQKPRALWMPDGAQLATAHRTFAALPGRWEIKISGGEPFLLQQLPALARGLVESGHTVSMLTNLSAPRAQLAGFVESCGERLRTFSCSLHLEHAEPQGFLEKVLQVSALLEPLPRATLVVNSVVVPGQVERLARIRALFEGRGLKFYPQLMRVDGLVQAYSSADAALIERHFGDLVGPGQINRGFSHLGEPCLAGARYFVVQPRGDAWACYPAKRAGEGYLGNVFEGALALGEGPQPCRYRSCPCTVPQNRGIVGAAPSDTPRR